MLTVYRGFNVKVLAYDKYKTVGYANDMSWVKEVDLNTIQNQADIISLHLPLTAETKYFANKDFIQHCKPGFVLLNTSRGKCVNTLDLIEALENGTIGGACLDVFENEKPNTFTIAEHQLYARLYNFENVVLSPHVAGWTHESNIKIAQTLAFKMLEVLKT